MEVYVKCPVEICAQRDPRSLYYKAFCGEIEEFTGVSAPFEPLDDPEMVIDQLLKGVFPYMPQNKHGLLRDGVKTGGLLSTTNPPS